jgi:TM2 domain-containing membrane protein YozV
MADESGSWYVRARGRILGPFNLAQLETMRDRGQLARFHEVSQDRQAWMGAAGLPQLFAPSDGGAGSSGSFASTGANGYGLAGDSGSQARAAASEDLAVWFYARDGAQQGPVPIGELRRMLATGQITAFTQVWTAGMPGWLPAHQVPEVGLGPFPGTASVGGSFGSGQHFQSPNAYASPSTKYCHHCGVAIAAIAEICPKCGVRQVGQHAGREREGSDSPNKIAACLFALFLGLLGAHRFYLGQRSWGVFYLLMNVFLFWTGIVPAIFLVVCLIEGVVYLTYTDSAFAARYARP